MKKRRLKRQLDKETISSPQIRTFLALITTPMKFPTINDDKTLAKNLIPMMTPHWATVTPLERDSSVKNELTREEEIPHRRRETQRIRTITKFMI